MLLALGSLIWSFGRDVLWLWRTSRVARRVPVARMRELVPAGR